MAKATKTKAKKRGKARAAKKAPTPTTRGIGARGGRLGRPVEVDASRQAVLEAFIPAICEVFGVAPEALVGRVPAGDALSLVTGSLRKLALGAVAMLGRDLGLPWSGIHGEAAPEVLVMVHRTTLSQFATQFGTWTGLNIDGHDETGEPTGDLARFARDHYLRIKREALTQAGPGPQRSGLVAAA